MRPYARLYAGPYTSPYAAHPLDHTLDRTFWRVSNVRPKLFTPVRLLAGANVTTTD